jgi:hypothetical protein
VTQKPRFSIVDTHAPVSATPVSLSSSLHL